jgi:hypothetical protein
MALFYVTLKRCVFIRKINVFNLAAGNSKLGLTIEGNTKMGSVGMP